MPKRNDIKKVLVIGSGPIVIGQAAEFDYSGTQACRALREEGMEVILINSNPATIMTDMETADRIYIEPIQIDFVKAIIKKEKPDGILASFGGQTALNMAIQLSEDGILDDMGIELLGMSVSSIMNAEDRELFKKTMSEINEPVALSTIVNAMDDGVAFAEKTGFPIIIRPAYTLGGAGGGIAHTLDEFKYILGTGLKLSMIHQVLLEKSLAGYKEIEYEVMRDSADNCITVCNMENFDPVGIHTGDSIVVAPSQTLSNREYQMLRSASLKIIRALKIEGGCNIQFALSPSSDAYFVIEVNPRVSRSSALASKATGYPIARIAAKIAIGMHLDEIPNPVTENSSACFEPALDYVVTKVPRWPFDKFTHANRAVGTQMKATGEVMAIGRTFEESLLKAIDSLDIKMNYQLGLALFENKTIEELKDILKHPQDEGIFAVFKALQKGLSIEEIANITKIDTFFLRKLENIVNVAEEIRDSGIGFLDYNLYLKAKKIGFGDSYIANLLDIPLSQLTNIRRKFPINPVYKMVDTCAGEFEAATPYFYSTYEDMDDPIHSGLKRDKVLVIGSGPIRIGQGIEFDYCSVHSVTTLNKLGYGSVIINNNPETVSTDFDTSDTLYFEPLTKECVLDIIHREKPLGVIVQFGGQTSINLARPLYDDGVQILGTSVKSIDIAEDRDKFLKLLDGLQIPIPSGSTAFSVAQAKEIAKNIGYPVLVRPSYVLGGRAMEVVYDDITLEEYMNMAADISHKHPVLIDRYISGREAEIDGLCDGTDVFIPGIMEHIERSGIHSGDSVAVYPPRTIDGKIQKTMVDYAVKLGRALHITGLFNIQFVIDELDQIYVIEVNPRASRTVPVLSKITGIPMVDIATRLIMGEKLKDLGYSTGLPPSSGFIAVKAPVFSFSRLGEVDPFLGPEMKSTGEVMGVDQDYRMALYKAFVASGLNIPKSGTVLLSVSDRDKEEACVFASKLTSMGFSLVATKGTARFLSNQGLTVRSIAHSDVGSLLQNGEINLVVNTPTRGKIPGRNGFLIRRISMEFNIPCFTSLDTANAALDAMEEMITTRASTVYSLDTYCNHD